MLLGVGKVAEFAAAPACLDCEAGYYSPYEGMASCLECIGQFFSTTGSTECNACRRNYFYSEDNDCVECPKGTSCPVDGGSTQEKLTLKPDYFRISATTTTIHKCPLLGACTGGTNFSETPGENEWNAQFYSYCAEGFAGPLCAACAAPGYYFDVDLVTCVMCGSVDDDSGKSTVVSRIMSPATVFFSLLIAVIMAGLVYLTCKPKIDSTTPTANEKKKLTESAGIFANTFFEALCTLKEKQNLIAVKLKSLTAFAQISVNVGFNLKIEYPKKNTRDWLRSLKCSISTCFLTLHPNVTSKFSATSTT